MLIINGLSIFVRKFSENCRAKLSCVNGFNCGMSR